MNDRATNQYLPRQPLERFTEREKYLIRRSFEAGREWERSLAPETASGAKLKNGGRDGQ